MRFCLLFLSLIFVSLSASGAFALIDLSIIHPTTDFTTNNQELQIEGMVESSIPAQVIVSTNTPAGVRNLAQVAHSIYSIVVDLGGSQQLQAILIRPVAVREFTFGPRLARIAFSQDGSNFPAGQLFNVSSGVDAVFHRTVVDLPSTISARFVQIEMLEGWQRGHISIESVEFLDKNNRIIQARIQSISILLDLTEKNRATFSISVLLTEGENRISLFAKALLSETVARETISLFYLSELRPEAADKGRFILSDGNRAKIVIPADALDERIKKLQLFSISPDEVNPQSYLRNIHIVKGTAPVVVYRFEALRQGRFAAEATSFLPDQPPGLAVDGILEPPSTWITSLVPLPIRLTIDLGTQQTLSRLVVHARVDSGKSFGPQSAKILISNDKENFTEILEVTGFDERTTPIELTARPSARYVRLEITESKQANNVQLNEVEFFDASEAKIVPFDTFDQLLLQGPAVLELSYDTSDLIAAGVTREADLKIFAWNSFALEWQLAGGEINPNRRTIRLELNYISQVALFQAVPSQIQAAWSFNPFSPDGNGIADTTRLTIVNPEGTPPGQTELVVEIFDLHNKLIRTLINRTVMSANVMSIEWDGRNQIGEIVNIGPYIYQIQLGSQIRNGVIVVGK